MKYELMELIDFVEDAISHFEYKYLSEDSFQEDRFQKIKDSFNDLKNYLKENK